MFEKCNLHFSQARMQAVWDKLDADQSGTIGDPLVHALLADASEPKLWLAVWVVAGMSRFDGCVQTLRSSLSSYFPERSR